MLGKVGRRWVARNPAIQRTMDVVGEVGIRIRPLIGKASPLFYFCAFVFVASLILGGGTRGGFLSDAILQLLALPLLIVASWKSFDIELTRPMRMALIFASAIAALPLIQLMPLPPWLWTALPGRQASAETFAIVGQAVPWMPLSTSPRATWLSALSLIPPLSIFLATLLLGYRERRWLSLLAIVVGVVSVLVGLLQVAQGVQSPLRFFEITNTTEAVGFFANRNHFAALLYCLILFTAAWIVNLTSSSRREKQYTYDPASIMAAIGVFTVLVVLLAGEVFARSRAGIALTMVALLASIALGFSQRGAVTAAAPGRKILIGAVVVTIAFSLQFALYRVLERVSDPTEDSRPAAAVTTFEAASANMPLGSGIGTFVPVYATFEKPQDVAPYYMNRAHNDVLEASLESGVLGLALMGLFATWLVRRSLAVWRSAPAGGANGLDWSLVRAATLVAGLIAAHSFVDYPLRTSAMTAIMAFACALLIEPPVGVYSRKSQELVVPRKIHTHDARNLEPVAAPALAVSRPQSPGPIPPTPGAMPPVPRPVPQTSASILSLSPDQRWGTDIEWPEEWSNRSEREGSAGKTVASNSPKPPKAEGV